MGGVQACCYTRQEHDECTPVVQTAASSRQPRFQRQKPPTRIEWSPELEVVKSHPGSPFAAAESWSPSSPSSSTCFFDCAENDEDLGHMMTPITSRQTSDAPDDDSAFPSFFPSSPPLLSLSPQSGCKLPNLLAFQWQSPIRDSSSSTQPLDPASRVVQKAREAVFNRVRAAEQNETSRGRVNTALPFEIAGPEDCCVGLPSSINIKLLREGCQEFDEWVTPGVARRVLKATEGNESQAANMLLKAVEIRVRDRELLRSMECEVASDARVIGRDLEAHPTIFISAKTQVAPLKHIRDQLVLAFEAACNMTNDEGTIMLLADMPSFKMSLNVDLFALQELSETLGTVYADRIFQIIVVDFSLAAQTTWRLIKPLMREKTQKKFAFLSVRDARAMLKTQFDDSTYQKICSCFDANRVSSNSVEDLMLHARRTAVGDVPLGSWETASYSEAEASESTTCGGSGSSS